MNKVATLMLAIVFFTHSKMYPHPTLTSNTILYVDQDATAGANDGSSWANAFTELQDALQEARANVQIIEIWVAEGVYFPTSGTDRSLSFDLVNGVSVRGGFAGNESLATERNMEAHPTILDGDLGLTDWKFDNSLHVVQADGIDDEDTVLEGFIIRGGYASGPQTDGLGGGLYVQSKGLGVVSRLQVRKCQFSQNEAEFGGGLANYAVDDASSELLIEFCTFDNNTASRGGGVYNFKGTGSQISANYFNSHFYQNTASQRGASMYNNGHSGQLAPPLSFNVQVINCIFYDNSAPRGGGIATQDINSSFQCLARNCTFFNNPSNGGDAIYLNVNGYTEISNSILWSGNEFFKDFNVLTGLTDINNWIEDNTAGSVPEPGFIDAAQRNFRLQGCAPVIDQGINYGLLTPLDADGQPRQYDGQRDMGAFEFTGLTLSLPIPAQPSLSLEADQEITDPNGWTHYYNCASDHLLLSIFKDGQDIGSLGNNGFAVRVVTNGGLGGGGLNLSAADYHTSTNSWYVFNRYWQVENANTLASPLRVRFYFDQQDVDDLNSSLQAEGIPPMTDLSSIILYHISGTGLSPHDTDVLANGGVYSAYSNTGTASSNSYLTGNFNGQSYAEYEVTSIENGGSAGVEAVDSPLPVELLSFTAQREQGQVVLNWITTSELNNDYFLVEKSADAAHFHPIAYTEAAGALNRQTYYQELDTNPYRGANYYRLKQIDLDGKYSYSAIVVVYMNDDLKDAWIFPNPATDQLSVQLREPLEGAVRLQIWDALRRVVREEVFPAAGQAVMKLSLEGLGPGMYVVKINGKRYRSYHPFIKADLK